MLTTGPFTRKVGVETNTMIRWLREDVIVPEEAKGRNNTFSFEEMLVGRAIAPLYSEWKLKTELLSAIAQFMRYHLSIRKELNYADHDSFVADIRHWRAVATHQLVLDDREGSEKDFTSYVQGAVDAANHVASERGVDLPPDWHESLDTAPQFEGELAERVRTYERLIDTMLGLDELHLFVARGADGQWSWVLGTYEGFRERMPEDIMSFIGVDLAKVLAD